MITDRFMTLDDGNLYRRALGDYKWRLLRSTYRRTFVRIENSLQLRATIRAGGHAWPGGYPLYLVCTDGGALCFTCARRRYRELALGHRPGGDPSWKAIACEVNYEDTSLTCANCNQPIESAYGED